MTDNSSNSWNDTNLNASNAVSDEVSSSRDIIPIISLAPMLLDGDETVVIDQIRRACMEHGFFYVKDWTTTCIPTCPSDEDTDYDTNNTTTNDAIDVHSMNQLTTSLQSQVLQQTKVLFESEEKQTLSDPITNRGYTGMGEETLDPSKQTCGDTKEGYYISCNDIAATSEYYNPQKLMGPNIWPSTLAEFRPVMETYIRAITALAHCLVHLISKSLYLNDGTSLEQHFRTHPMGMLRLLHYNAVPSNVDEGILACGEHSDYGMITLLLLESNGLQIRKRSSEWISVPPISGTYVINLGDMLQRWTNGIYKSTEHRVVNTHGRERYSVPYFYEPRFDTLVRCVATCCSDGNDDNSNESAATTPTKTMADHGVTLQPPKYTVPVTSGQYLLQKYQQTHTDFEGSSM